MDRVTEYANKVVSGEIVAGELHRLACQRHIDDLKKQRTTEFPYYYNVEKANEIINFAETLVIAEGAEPRPVRLIDSQAFDLGVTFGWFKVTNDKRRFRRRYKSMARQNGKTFENGIMGTYIAGFGEYNYGKLFTVATKKRQARLAWDQHLYQNEGHLPLQAERQHHFFRHHHYLLHHQRFLIRLGYH